MSRSKNRGGSSGSRRSSRSTSRSKRPSVGSPPSRSQIRISRGTSPAAAERRAQRKDSQKKKKPIISIKRVRGSDKGGSMKFFSRQRGKNDSRLSIQRVRGSEHGGSIKFFRRQRGKDDSALSIQRVRGSEHGGSAKFFSRQRGKGDPILSIQRVKGSEHGGSTKFFRRQRGKGDPIFSIGLVRNQSDSDTTPPPITRREAHAGSVKRDKARAEARRGRITIKEDTSDSKPPELVQDNESDQAAASSGLTRREAHARAASRDKTRAAARRGQIKKREEVTEDKPVEVEQGNDASDQVVETAGLSRREAHTRAIVRDRSRAVARRGQIRKKED